MRTVWLVKGLLRADSTPCIVANKARVTANWNGSTSDGQAEHPPTNSRRIDSLVRHRGPHLRRDGAALRRGPTSYSWTAGRSRPRRNRSRFAALPHGHRLYRYRAGKLHIHTPYYGRYGRPRRAGGCCGGALQTREAVGLWNHPQLHHAQLGGPYPARRTTTRSTGTGTVRARARREVGRRPAASAAQATRSPA